MSIIEKALEMMNENKDSEKEVYSEHSTEDSSSQQKMKETQKDEATPVISEKNSEKYIIDLDELEKRGYLTPNSSNKILFEQYRRIKMSVLGKAFENRKATNNIIMVTSSLSGEGKSYTSLNLAMSIAYEFNYTVMHMDADLIRQTTSRMFGLENEDGLIQYLNDDTKELADVILTTNIPKLNIIPSGFGGGDLITELLNSHRMESLILEMSKRYNDRIIIIDSPPMMMDSSSRALLKLARQTVFVVEAEKTPKFVVDDALNVLSEYDNVGVVLNKSNQRASSSYGYYYK